MLKSSALLVLMATLSGLPAQAAIKEETIEYKDGETVLEGFLAFDEAGKGKLPGVLIVHDWLGLGDFSKEKARALARMGYAGFAVDIYGKGVRAKDSGEAGKLAGLYKKDLSLMRSRIRSAFDVLSKRANVDPARIAVMGYCFGGTVALELARAGVPIAGAVSFHGGLGTPNASDAKNIKGKILVLHGADDPYVPPSEVESFMKEMRDAKVDWQFIAYGGAVHAFTNPALKGVAGGASYEEKADRRSWIALQSFFKEIFGS